MPTSTQPSAQAQNAPTVNSGGKSGDSGALARDFVRWSLVNVLIAGRRLAGEAWGRDETEAVRRFAATQARELKVDVATAVASALADPLKRVSPKTRSNKNHNQGGNHG